MEIRSDKKYISDIVERMLVSDRFKKSETSTPETKIRLIVDKMQFTEANLDFYSFLPKLYDSLQKVDFGYASKLKLQAFSVSSEFSLSELGPVNMSSHYLSVISPYYRRRYKNIAQLSMDLTRKLRHLEVLGEDDILTISDKGEYIFVSRMNIRMVLRHLKPTLFGLLILLALGERIISVAHTNAYKARPDYSFPYFMVVAANVWHDLDANLPRKKEAFNSRYATLMEIFIDLGIKGSEYSTSFSNKVKLSDLDLSENYKQSKVRLKARKEQSKINRDEVLNTQFAEATIAVDEMPYNPHISKEQRVMNKTGIDLGGARKETSVRHSAQNSEFRQLMDSYKVKIVK